MTVTEIYKKAGGKNNFSALHFGPAHIVWEDANFEDEHIQWCIDHFDEYARDFDPKDLALVKQSLFDLLEIPESERLKQQELEGY